MEVSVGLEECSGLGAHLQAARKVVNKPSVDAKELHVTKQAKKFAPLYVVNPIVLFGRLTVYLVFKSEMFYRREHLGELMENLCHGRYLPVEVPAVDGYGKSVHLGISIAVHLHINLPSRKLEFGTPEPQVLCCVINNRRRGTENVSWLKKSIASFLRAQGSIPLYPLW